MESVSHKPYIQPSLREQLKQKKKLRRKMKKLAAEKQLSKGDDKLLTWVQKNPTENLKPVLAHTALRRDKQRQSGKEKVLNDVAKKLLNLSSNLHNVLERSSVTNSINRHKCIKDNDINSEIVPKSTMTVDNIDNGEILGEENGIDSYIDSHSLNLTLSSAEVHKTDNMLLNKSMTELESIENPSCKRNQKYQEYDAVNDLSTKKVSKRKIYKKGSEMTDAMTQYECVDSSLTRGYQQLETEKIDMEPITIEMESGCNPPQHYLMTEDDVKKPSCSNVGNTDFLLGHNNVLSLLKCSSVTTETDLNYSSSVMDYAVNEEDSYAQKEEPYTVYIVPNNKVLLVMRHPNKLFFRGKLLLSVLIGSIEILGYKIGEKNRQKRYTVYCPRGSSLLCLQTCSEQSDINNRKAVNSKLISLGMDSSHVEDIIADLADMDCLLLLEKTQCELVNFVNKYFTDNMFPIIGLMNKKNWQFNKAEEKLQCQFVLPETEKNVRLFTKRREWKGVTDKILGQHSNNGIRTMLCGGKSVGKSTFLRYLINRSLLEFEEVLCIDLDPGQAEFTVPGCVSATVVREPLLGPNFTHLLTPHRMVYLGEINMAQCPGQYLKSAHYIIEYCKAHTDLCKMPWFINTMGFSKGLGIELMINLIRMVNPRDVVQIESITKKRNFAHYLSANYVWQYPSTLLDVPVILCSVLDYNLHVLPSAAEFSSRNHSHWGLEAHKMRDLVLLAYLSQMVVPPMYSLSEIIPFTTLLSALKLSVCHEIVQYSQFLAAMNGNLVALCTAGDKYTLVPSDKAYPQVLEKLPICPCLGFGIVRGIDMDDKQLFLITPLREQDLAQVNCLVMGNVSLPNSVRLKAIGIVGHIPYTTEGSGPPINRKLKRSQGFKRLPRSRSSVQKRTQ